MMNSKSTLITNNIDIIQSNIMHGDYKKKAEKNDDEALKKILEMEEEMAKTQICAKTLERINIKKLKQKLQTLGKRWERMLVKY
jgi:proline dehydrogenase